MPETPSGSPAGSGDVLLMVGTTKGAFLFTSGPDRTKWEVDGPHFAGEEVYALASEHSRDYDRTPDDQNYYKIGAA